jgi:hypothetical protein
LKPPVQADVVAYFREQAPEKLVWPHEALASSPSPVRFRRQPLTGDGFAAMPFPAISFLEWRNGKDVWLSDMRTGVILRTTLDGSDLMLLRAFFQNPVAVRECDLNGNGKKDLVLCDLGSFLPEDHQRGKVVWLPDGAETGGADPIAVLENVGRIADVRAADFDGDGDQDLVVAEFGWHRTGGIHVLWNEPPDTHGGLPTFRDELLDRRPGAIHVPTVDLNGDGRIDFLALISQEHETVVAFLNTPTGFQKEIVFAAGDPAFGSSGIEVCDFDRDGDWDVLLTNGDTFDSFMLKPYHGIRWLENEGRFPFREHFLAAMPGVHRALAADVDGDGDADVVAAALVPAKLRDPTKAVPLDAVIWLEQTQPGQFVRHVVSTGDPIHAAMAVGDIDADGDVDILAGGFYGEMRAETPAVIVFINEGPEP